MLQWNIRRSAICRFRLCYLCINTIFNTDALLCLNNTTFHFCLYVFIRWFFSSNKYLVFQGSLITAYVLDAHFVYSFCVLDILSMLSHCFEHRYKNKTSFILQKCFQLTQCSTNQFLPHPPSAGSLNPSPPPSPPSYRTAWLVWPVVYVFSFCYLLYCTLVKTVVHSWINFQRHRKSRKTVYYSDMVHFKVDNFYYCRINGNYIKYNISYGNTWI